MTIYIIAQIVGCVGYFFYISAPQFKTQEHITRMEVVAYAVLSFQWYLLSLPTLMLINLLGLVTAILALYACGQGEIRKFLYLLYPIAVTYFFIFSNQGLVDMMAIIALCCVITSKLSTDLVRFRFYALLAGALLATCAIVTGSAAAIVFNLLFALGHIYRLMQLAKPKVLSASLVETV